MSVLCDALPLELDQNLLGVFEVLPGSLGANIDTAGGIASPAVLARVEEVVRIHIGSLLTAVETLAVEPVLRLQSRCNVTSSEIVVQSDCEEEGESEALRNKSILIKFLQRCHRWAESHSAW